MKELVRNKIITTTWFPDHLHSLNMRREISVWLLPGYLQLPPAKIFKIKQIITKEKQLDQAYFKDHEPQAFGADGGN